MRAPTWMLSLIALAAAPAALVAQLDNARSSLLVGGEFRTVTYGAGIGTKTMSEFAAPIAFALPVSRRVAFDIGTYFVSATRKDETGGSTSLSGLTDVIARGAFQLKPDVAVFTVALNLPTGSATLDGNERLVAGSAATDLIPYPVQNFGSGLSVTSGLALAAPVGSWALGIAGSYRYNGEYTPFAEKPDTALQPGAEMRFRVGADRIVGQGRVSLGLTYSTFSNDDFGSNAYSPGSRIIPQFSLSLPMGNNNLSIYSWDIYRNVKEDTTVGSAKENTLVLGAVLSLRMGRNTLRPVIEYRKAWVGPGGLQSNGSLFGVGARYAIAVGTRMTVVPSARLDLGSLPNGASSVSFTGLSGSLTFRAAW